MLAAACNGNPSTWPEAISAIALCILAGFAIWQWNRR